MRVAFNGKGGSGKTTLSALFTRYLEREQRTVLAIDADVNEHLHAALGMPAPKAFIGSEYQAVATYFEGERVALQSLAFDEVPELGTMPPGRGSRFVRLQDDDPFLQQYAHQRGSLRTLAIGGHENKDTGDSCYHVKLNSAELLLHRTLDRTDEWVVIDTTAGVDSVGTSLVSAYDLFVFAVEPTNKSLSVFEDFQRITANASFPVRCVAVPNKVRTAEDLAFLQERISADSLLPAMPYSKALRRQEQGADIDWSQLLLDAEPTMTAIAAAAEETHRDWDAYYRTVSSLYTQRCKGWWNGFTGRDLSGLVDDKFSYTNEFNTAEVSA